MQTKFWQALATAAFAAFAFDERVFGQINKNCRTATSCTACILAGPLCGWCFQKDLVLTARCDQLDSLELSGCNSSNIFAPKSKLTLLKNDALRNADFTLHKPSVQLAPQHVRVRLAPGRPVDISLQFRIAKDNPVDLYYLMDLSLSMVDDRESLAKLGFNLRDTLLNVTRNVKLGFGAFVDKPIKPYIDVRPEVLRNACILDPGCTSNPYGYVNRLSLTSDTDLFVSRVQTSDISVNLDGAEGGLDALVQAIVCQNIIGWRAHARKLVIYATDSTSHISGDGKLGGIVEPNDGRCHMSADQYTHSGIMDYPSIGQIANIVKSKSVNVIFAIVEQYKDYYEELANLIPGSVVGMLNESSNNVVELVKNNFQAIVSKAELAIDGLEDDDRLSVKTSSSCGSGSSHETKVCDGLKIGDTVSFDLQLQIDSCTTSASQGNASQKVLYVKVLGLEERLQIDVEIDCDCDCNDKVASSDICSAKGLYNCGECYCDTGYLGSHCECSTRTGVASAVTLQEYCIRPGSNQPCSGRGLCTGCGSCECSCLPLAGAEDGYCNVSGDRYSGKFCECNPKGCNSFKGRICGGEGVCRCDTEGQNYCECSEQFENGDLAACDCPKSTATCMADSTEGTICNGRGVCVCGLCHCNDTCYTGGTCSILRPECSWSCQKFTPCVKCLQPAGQQCPRSCQNVSVNTLNSLPPGRVQTCRYADHNLCEASFVLSYDYSTGRHAVGILSEQKCHFKHVLNAVACVIGVTVLLGVSALLIWKVAVTIYDRKHMTAYTPTWDFTKLQ